MKRRKDDNKKRGPLPLCSSTSLILGMSDIGHGSKWIFRPCVSQNYIFPPQVAKLCQFSKEELSRKCCLIKKQRWPISVRTYYTPLMLYGTRNWYNNTVFRMQLACLHQDVVFRFIYAHRFYYYPPKG